MIKLLSLNTTLLNENVQSAIVHLINQEYVNKSEVRENVKIFFAISNKHIENNSLFLKHKEEILSILEKILN
jgi:hypothetical protein